MSDGEPRHPAYGPGSITDAASYEKPQPRGPQHTLGHSPLGALADDAKRRMRDAARQFLALPMNGLTPEERSALHSISQWTVPPAEIDPAELMRRARAVVDARYRKGGEWEELKDAIAELADLTGGGEIER